METSERDLQRMALAAPTTWDEENKTASVVISTDGDVGDGIQLVHEQQAIRWPSRPIPAVLDHRRTADAVWGVVETLELQRVDGRNALIGRVRLDGSPDAMAQAEPRLRNGSARFSVGARIHRLDAPAPGLSLDRATDWSIAELSLVVAGADEKSVMRSDGDDQPNNPEPPMPDETIQAGGDPAVEVQRAADPAPAAASVTSDASTVELERTVADLKRERDITRSCLAAKLSPEQTQEFIDSGRSHDDVVRSIFALMAEKMSNSPAGHPARVEVTRDEGDDLRRGVGEWLEHRCSVVKQPSDNGRRFIGRSILEIGRMMLESRGIDTTGMSKNQLVDRAFHSTSDFPELFANTAGKRLLQGYEEEPQTWMPLASRRDLPDFKSVSDLQLQGQVVPELTLEGGEYTAGTLVEGKASWSLSTYTRKLLVSRQAIINDDLSALDRVPNILGRGCRLMESNKVWELLTTGSVTGGQSYGGGATTGIDGAALFAQAHNNTGTGALSIGSVDAGYVKMRKQKDIASNELNLEPAFLIVPTSLRTTALQFLFPAGYAPAALTGNSATNPFAGGLQLIVENRLETDSSALWYLAASPNRIEMIQYGYLAGEAGPTITTNEKRDPDGIELLVREDFGCTVSDFRGFYRSTGA